LPRPVLARVDFFADRGSPFVLLPRPLPFILDECATVLSPDATGNSAIRPLRLAPFDFLAP
jgi:hypothetical protein